MSEKISCKSVIKMCVCVCMPMCLGFHWQHNDIVVDTLALSFSWKLFFRIFMDLCVRLRTSLGRWALKMRNKILWHIFVDPFSPLSLFSDSIAKFFFSILYLSRWEEFLYITLLPFLSFIHWENKIWQVWRPLINHPRKRTFLSFWKVFGWKRNVCFVFD